MTAPAGFQRYMASPGPHITEEGFHPVQYRGITEGDATQEGSALISATSHVTRLLQDHDRNAHS
jgi:hypothetical protein